jgi:hypothetical protein
MGRPISSFTPGPSLGRWPGRDEYPFAPRCERARAQVRKATNARPALLDSTRGSPTASEAIVKLASVLSIFLGLGFGLPCAYAIRYLSTRGKVWTFLGFPTYGGGPFEGIGIRTTVALLVAFLVVCGLEVVTGWLLWRGLHAGAVLAVALLPVEVAFWIGFALPLGPPLGLARAILVMMKWSSLTRPSN